MTECEYFNHVANNLAARKVNQISIEPIAHIYIGCVE